MTIFDPTLMKQGLARGDSGCLPMNQYSLVAGHALSYMEQRFAGVIRPVSYAPLNSSQSIGYRYLAAVKRQDISLCCLSVGVDAQAYSPADDALHLFMFTDGKAMSCPNGNILSAGSSGFMVLPPGEPFNCLLTKDAQQIIIRIDREFIRQYGLDFIIKSLNKNDATLQRIEHLTLRLLGQLNVATEFNLAELAVDIWADDLRQLLLGELSVNLSESPISSPPAGDKDQYSLASEFETAALPESIRSYLLWLNEQDDNCSLNAFIDTLSVSSRKFYLDFQKSMRCTPFQYLKLQKLRRLRVAMLENPAAYLADLATIHGFSHLGRFSQYYQQIFGHLPSIDRAEERKILADQCHRIPARQSNLCWLEGNHRAPVKALDMRCQHCMSKLTA